MDIRDLTIDELCGLEISTEREPSIDIAERLRRPDWGPKQGDIIKIQPINGQFR